jgi:DNA topoisomerase-1
MTEAMQDSGKIAKDNHVDSKPPSSRTRRISLADDGKIKFTHNDIRALKKSLNLLKKNKPSCRFTSVEIIQSLKKPIEGLLQAGFTYAEISRHVSQTTDYRISVALLKKFLAPNPINESAPAQSGASPVEADQAQGAVQSGESAGAGQAQVVAKAEEPSKAQAAIQSRESARADLAQVDARAEEPSKAQAAVNVGEVQGQKDAPAPAVNTTGDASNEVPADPVSGPKTDGDGTRVCPECGKPLAHRISKRPGKEFDFWGCSGYPGCKVTFDDNDGKPGKTHQVRRPPPKAARPQGT